MRLVDADELIKKAWDADTRVGYVQVVGVGDIEEAPTIEPKQEWISVKDRLPKKDERVLVFWDDGFEIGIYVGGEVGDDVYWMPLPEPPEMNNKEEQA